MLLEIPLHIPDVYPCSIVDNKFLFEKVNLSVKPSLVKLVISWNKDWGFSSILYDQKFVSLLLLEIFGKEKLIEEGKLNNNKMRFIKDVFIKRVKGDPNRTIRFGDYVQGKRQELRKTKKQH